MKRYQEYLNVFLIIVSLIIFLFYKFINGDYIFASGDTLAPQAIKHGIESISGKTGNFPYWFPYIFSGMPTVHSLLNTSEFYFPHKIITLFHGLGLAWIWNFLLHYLFSALGMYSLLRFLKQSKTVSIFSSITILYLPIHTIYSLTNYRFKSIDIRTIHSIYIPNYFIYIKRNITIQLALTQSIHSNYTHKIFLVF